MDIVQKTIDYFRSSKAELEKVTWPSKQDTFRYSTLVIGVSIALALFFGVLDKGLLAAVKAVINARPAPARIQQQPVTQTPIDASNAIELQTAPGTNPGQVKIDQVPVQPDTKTVPATTPAPTTVPTTPTKK